MISVQDWLAPLIGSIIIILIPLLVARMSNTVLKRLRSDDQRTHESRLSRRVPLSRKEEERERLLSVDQWDRIESYTRARNISLLVAFAVFLVNVALIVIVLTLNMPLLAVSLLVLFVALIMVALWLGMKKPQRPVWVTTQGYYRGLVMGKPEKGPKEGK